MEPIFACIELLEGHCQAWQALDGAMLAEGSEPIRASSSSLTWADKAGGFTVGGLVFLAVGGISYGIRHVLHLVQIAGGD